MNPKLKLFDLHIHYNKWLKDFFNFCLTNFLKIFVFQVTTQNTVQISPDSFLLGNVNVRK
jgi:hypothetical protein